MTYRPIPQYQPVKRARFQSRRREQRTAPAAPRLYRRRPAYFANLPASSPLAPGARRGGRSWLGAGLSVI